MTIIISYFYIVVFLSLSLCSNEELVYKANIKHLTAGTAIFKKNNTIQADSTISISFDLKTNKFFD